MELISSFGLQVGKPYKAEVLGPRKPKARGPWTGGNSGLNKNRRYADLKKRRHSGLKTGGNQRLRFKSRYEHIWQLDLMILVNDSI